MGESDLIEHSGLVKNWVRLLVQRLKEKRASKEKEHNDNAKDYIGRSRSYIYSGNRRANAGRTGARFDPGRQHAFHPGPNSQEAREARKEIGKEYHSQSNKHSCNASKIKPVISVQRGWVGKSNPPLFFC